MKSQYLRTFIGLPLCLEQGTLDARLDLMSALEGERISWVDPARFHVTLRFLGDTTVSAIQNIGQALHTGLSIPVRTRLELTGLDSFGPRKRPRVIWVGFEQTDFFESLKYEVDRVLESCGIQAEQQAFRAHLTLGRIRKVQNLNRYYHIIEERHQHFSSRIIFEKLVFYQSLLGPGGPEYQVLDEIRFH
jgi:RNA 2',3'-cyclic 3'-phosphodiesterase